MKHGFTLIELLVVIAIIAVLSAAGFAGGSAAMNKARKVSAQAGATSIATAIDQFYAEYSALPDPIGTSAADAEFDTTSANGKTLLNILAGLDTGDQNPRKIRFLSGKEAKNQKDGIEYSSDGKSIVGMYDPWSKPTKLTPYYIRLDYGYDERLTVDPAGSSPSVTLNGRRAVVYSLGVAKDDTPKTTTVVKTW